jgi:hypothetical protein
MTVPGLPSQLLTGVSLAVTATTLILNILSNRDGFDFSPLALSSTIFFIFASFYLAMFYLYIQTFDTNLDFIGARLLFLLVFFASLISIGIPLLSFMISELGD